MSRNRSVTVGLLAWGGLLGALLPASVVAAREPEHLGRPERTASAEKGLPGSAVAAGGYLYLSGQGPRRPDGTMPSTLEEQVRQALENVKAALEGAGSHLDHVVYLQVYLTREASYSQFDRALGEYFPTAPPARAILGVAALPDPPVQLSVVAVERLDGRQAVRPSGFSAREWSPPAVLTHDRLFISGMTGIDPATGRVPDDPADEVDNALERMRAVVRAAGLDLGHVVFVNPYLTAEMPMRVMNERYARRFEFGNTPARATIRVSSLPAGARIEYTGVAVRDLRDRRAVRPKNMPPSPTASPCVFAGETLYCSAKSGFIPGPMGGVYATTVEHQLRQTMRNLLDNLEEAGMDFGQVVSTNVYLDDLGDTPAFGGLFRQYFGPTPPASTFVQQLPPAERRADPDGRYPELEQVSLVAVRDRARP